VPGRIGIVRWTLRALRAATPNGDIPPMNGTQTFRLLAVAALTLTVGKTAVGAAVLPAMPAAPAAAATSGQFAPVRGDYKIHPGDQLAVSVYGEPTLSQNVTVLPDSTIAFPMIGRVSLANQNTTQASATLRTAFSKFLREPIVSVGVVTEGQLTVMVLGNVKTPGKYTLPYNSHMTDAVAAAGGIGPTNGDYPVARVSDTGGVRDGSLQQILRGGDVSADLTLNDNSVVYVPSPVTFNIEVVGAVDHPGEISISEGDRLTTAIAKAGNSANANADLNNIRVTRNLGNGQNTVFNINLYNQLQHGDLASDITLQKNDVVYVPASRKSGSNTTGAIFGVLLHAFGLGF
jgi:polysaccharide export outer membrane protein